MKRILHIAPNFNYNCGRSKLVFLYLKYFKNRNSYEVHFITNGGDSLERLKEIGVDYKIYKFFSGLKNIFYQKKFLNELREYLIENEIQLIHTHHRFPEYISVKIAKDLKIKIVATALSFVKGYKKLSFKSDKIICVSNSLSSYLQKNYGVDRKKLITLYNPDDESSYFKMQELLELKKELKVNSENKILLFMGRINIEKGYDVLLKAFQFVKNEYKDAVLLLCGNIEDKNFNKISDLMNSSVKVIYPGPNMTVFYGIADLVVLPSRIDPFPFVMVEAGSFKKAFIGGNTGGIAEFIENGKDGLLVQPGNSAELAEKIIYLLKNEDYAKSLGENLFKKVKEKCDYNNYFRKVEEIYNSLLINP
jgi:glycosyltransferase involved in cell wall biosynthesis